VAASATSHLEPSRRAPSPRRAALALALWTAVVLGLSSSTFSASTTSSILLPILRALFPGASEQALALAHGAIRKAAHVTEYGVLGALALRAAALRKPASWRRASVLALAYAVGIASVDELHQATTTTRTGAVSDVFVDASGATLGIGVLALAARRRPGTLLPLGGKRGEAE
jgi:VanZ family protein